MTGYCGDVKVGDVFVYEDDHLPADMTGYCEDVEVGDVFEHEDVYFLFTCRHDRILRRF